MIRVHEIRLAVWMVDTLVRWMDMTPAPDGWMVGLFSLRISAALTMQDNRGKRGRTLGPAQCKMKWHKSRARDSPSWRSELN